MVMEVKVPPKFYWDHVERDLPGGTVVKTTYRHVLVRLDADEAAELLDDARHYAREFVNDQDMNLRGLASSAAATVRRLEAAGVR